MDAVETDALQDGDRKSSPKTSDNGADIDVTELSFFARVRTDKLHRRKWLLTGFMCWSFVVLGVAIGQTGPALPDLQLILNEDLQSVSWLIFALFLGYPLGSLVSGFLYDRYDRMLLLLVSLLGMTVTTIVLPWCPTLAVMLVVRVVFGISVGGLETGGNTLVASTWSTEGQPFMQALHFSFALGGIFSPLMTEPFLAPKVTETSDFHQLNVTGKRTNSFGKTNTIPLTGSYSGVESSNNFTDKQAHGTPEYRETKVHFAYLVSGLLLLSAALPFLYLTFRKWSIGNKRESKDSSSHTNKEGKMSRRLRVTMLILLSLLMLAYCSIEDNFSSFLMTFLISQLNWSKYLGSMATSAYWAAFGTGRFCGIFISRCLSPVKMLGIFYVSFCFSFIGLLVTTIPNLNVLVWIFVVISGFSSSVIFPSVFSWTEDKVMHVSGKIAAMFQITASVGSMTTPLLLGYLMENYTPMWYVYLITGLSGVGLMLYLVIVFFVNTQIPGHQTGNKDPKSDKKEVSLDLIPSNEDKFI